MYYTDKSNQEVLDELDKVVYGHTNVKKVLINLVNRSRVRHYQKWVKLAKKDEWVEPGKCLILGPSGTGKTHMVECLSEMLNFPLVTIDATRLSPTGAGDGIKSDDLTSMIKKKAAEYGRSRLGYAYSTEGALDQVVVFIDEIDKLGRKFDSSGNWNSHVQSNFLSLFDNRSVFAGVSFIFAGAFTTLTERSLNGIGFTKEESDVDDRTELSEQVIEAGLIPELVGRCSAIVRLDSFKEQDYYNILTQIVLPKKLKDLKAFNVSEDIFTEEILRNVAKKAFKSGQGVRSIKRSLDEFTLDKEFNYLDNMPAGRILLLEGYKEGLFDDSIKDIK